VEHYPTARFNHYQNLFFFCEKKCLACHDHYGYDADISVGDVWLFRLKDDPIKHTGMIIRTSKGGGVFDLVVSAGGISSEPLDVRIIMDGQSRIGPSHYNVSARVKAGRHFGIRLKDNVKERVKWHHLLNAYLSIANMRLSESSTGQAIIFGTPRSIVKFYLYVKKTLETLR
jgi:coenzyme F420-reducing hydrogenase beta subunit